MKDSMIKCYFLNFNDISFRHFKTEPKKNTENIYQVSVCVPFFFAKWVTVIQFEMKRNSERRTKNKTEKHTQTHPLKTQQPRRRNLYYRLSDLDVGVLNSVVLQIEYN